ncbi:chromate efflux transporter [Micrococcales bacterium 31B]|nr:chromate efflux transporter [Micrococcales bacterium 31B]
MSREPNPTPRASGTPLEVLAAFTRLGLTSFGGPVAHLGYFRAEFVERRRWLDDREYGDIVALCQFLPGPASSQVGFVLGLRRAGGLGALAAFVGFTLPSALLMVAVAFGAALFDGPVGEGVLSGLKLVAVAIVAQAVWGMARTLTPDRTRAAIGLAGLALALLVSGAFGQVGAIIVGALAGWLFLRPDAPAAPLAPARAPRVPRWLGLACLVAFAGLLLGGPLLAQAGGAAALFSVVYRAGALVFGGGHVILPLLQSGTVDAGWVSQPEFLAGYGAAQAVPGPLSTFAAYVGAVAHVPPGGALGLWGALIALVAIFLPGFLLVLGVLPIWDALRARPGAQAALAGANAAVVGVLAAALYDPVFTSGVTSAAGLVVAAAGFVALTRFAAPPWVVVLGGALLGVPVHLWG